MENPTPFKPGQNPFLPPPPVNQEHVLMSFGSLRFTKDGILTTGVNSVNNNGSSSATKPESRKTEDFKIQSLSKTTTLEQVSGNGTAAGKQSFVSDAKDNCQEKIGSSIADKEWYKMIMALPSRKDPLFDFPSSSSSLPYHHTTSSVSDAKDNSQEQMVSSFADREWYKQIMALPSRKDPVFNFPSSPPYQHTTSSVSDAKDNSQEKMVSSFADKEWYKQIMALPSRKDPVLPFLSSSSSLPDHQSSVSDAKDSSQEKIVSSFADKEWYKQIMALPTRKDPAFNFLSSSSSIPYLQTANSSNSALPIVDDFSYPQSRTDSVSYNNYQDCNGLYDDATFNNYLLKNYCQQGDSCDIFMPNSAIQQLTKVMIFGTYEMKQSLLSQLLETEGSIITVMTDDTMDSFFEVLLDQSEGLLFDSLVNGILSRSRMFVNAAFLKQGACSILKLVKKVKKTDHAFSLTTVLSTRFFDLMTHPVAKTIVQQCLILFRPDANQVLIESAIYHCRDLGMHKVGCRSLNELINTLNPGPQRLALLKSVAIASASLAHDPYGNYVVQNVLDHKEYEATYTVLLQLQNQFVELAKQKEGSHVVEKCMACAKCALVFVVDEMLAVPGTVYQLAQHPFGNYVIQRALKMTKELDNSGPYMSLVRALEPYVESLKKSPGGKILLGLLKEGLDSIARATPK